MVGFILIIMRFYGGPWANLINVRDRVDLHLKSYSSGFWAMIKGKGKLKNKP